MSPSKFAPEQATLLAGAASTQKQTSHQKTLLLTAMLRHQLFSRCPWHTAHAACMQTACQMCRSLSSSGGVEGSNMIHDSYSNNHLQRQRDTWSCERNRSRRKTARSLNTSTQLWPRMANTHVKQFTSRVQDRKPMSKAGEKTAHNGNKQQQS